MLGCLKLSTSLVIINAAPIRPASALLDAIHTQARTSFGALSHHSADAAIVWKHVMSALATTGAYPAVGLVSGEDVQQPVLGPLDAVFSNVVDRRISAMETSYEARDHRFAASTLFGAEVDRVATDA